MALHFDFSKCADEEFLRSDAQWPLTAGIVEFTMSVGMGEITEKNVYEFFARLKILEAYYGPLFYTSKAPYLITLDDLRNRIGMTTNVSDETTTKWMRRFEQNARFDHVKRLSEAKKVSA